jgi:hypothetical protein
LENTQRRNDAIKLNILYEKSTLTKLILQLQRRVGYSANVVQIDDSDLEECAIQIAVESFATPKTFEDFLSDYPTTRLDDETKYCYKYPSEISKEKFSFWIFPRAQISSLDVHIRKSVYPLVATGAAIKADRIEFDYLLAKEEWVSKGDSDKEKRDLMMDF